jgi:hypothetical protein
MSEASAVLLPLGSRPTLRPPNPALALLLAPVTTQVGDYLVDNLPDGAPAGQRDRAAILLRLRLKYRVWSDLLEEAKLFRAELTHERRVHRLEKFIEEKIVAMKEVRRLFLAYGGPAGDVPAPVP